MCVCCVCFQTALKTIHTVVESNKTLSSCNDVKKVLLRIFMQVAMKCYKTWQCSSVTYCDLWVSHQLDHFFLLLFWAAVFHQTLSSNIRSNASVHFVSKTWSQVEQNGRSYRAAVLSSWVWFRNGSKPLWSLRTRTQDLFCLWIMMMWDNGVCER